MCHKIKNALEKFHLLAEKLILMYFIRAESIRGFNNKSKKSTRTLIWFRWIFLINNNAASVIQKQRTCSLGQDLR